MNIFLKNTYKNMFINIESELKYSILFNNLNINKLSNVLEISRYNDINNINYIHNNYHSNCITIQDSLDINIDSINYMLGNIDINNIQNINYDLIIINDVFIYDKTTLLKNILTILNLLKKTGELLIIGHFWGLNNNRIKLFRNIDLINIYNFPCILDNLHIKNLKIKDNTNIYIQFFDQLNRRLTTDKETISNTLLNTIKHRYDLGINKNIIWGSISGTKI